MKEIEPLPALPLSGCRPIDLRRARVTAAYAVFLVPCGQVLARDAARGRGVQRRRRRHDRLGLNLVQKPTRLNFALGALDGLAEEGAALLLPVNLSGLSEPEGAR